MLATLLLSASKSLNGLQIRDTGHSDLNSVVYRVCVMKCVTTVDKRKMSESFLFWPFFVFPLRFLGLVGEKNLLTRQRS